MLVKNNLKDPRFSSKVALVCCALHNQLERWASTFAQSWLGDIDALHPGINDQENHRCDAGAEEMQNALAQYVHANLPAVYM